MRKPLWTRIYTCYVDNVNGNINMMHTSKYYHNTTNDNTPNNHKVDDDDTNGTISNNTMYVTSNHNQAGNNTSNDSHNEPTVIHTYTIAMRLPTLMSITIIQHAQSNNTHAHE